MTDANDHPTTYAYDAANHLTSVTDADGKVTSYTYDDSGNLASRTDANDHTTTWAYDLANRLTSMTDPLDHTWSIGYDGSGNPTTKTDANGNTTSYAFDELNRLTSITYADGSAPAVAFAYNANGDRLSMTDGAGTESYVYDALDRLVEVSRGADSFAYTYDAAGNLLTREYPDGTSTAYAYDDDGRMASATTEPYPRPADTTAPSAPTGLTATLVGSNQINLAWTGSTDAVGVQGYKLYRDGAYLAAVGPVGSTSFSDTGLGVGVTHTYRVAAIDAAANESAQSGPASATTTPLDTTAPSVPTGLTAVATAWNRVTVAWTASTDDRAVTAYQVFRGGVLVATVSGSVTTFSDRDTDASTAYSYTVKAMDAAGNASAASAQASVTTKPAPTLSAAATYTYDAAGNLLTETSADGITATFTYDRAGRLLELANVTATGTLSRFTYGLDPAGNRTSLTTTRGSQYFTYDVLNRLTGVCFDGSCAAGQTPQPCLGCVGSSVSTPAATTSPDPADLFTTYTYDPVGNRLSEATHLGTTAYSYDAADRLTSRTPSGGPAVTYGYDDNGNQTNAGPATFAYDLADRLSSATVGSTTETYGYAGDGVRLEATRGPSDATAFVVDRNFALPQLAQERDGNGDPFRTYTYGLSPISQAAATGVSYLHHDPLGSVTDITSATGTSLAWTEYQPFGGVRSAGVAGGASASPLGFTGQYLDGATGLYHLRARQYDPTTGRFMTLDPLVQSATRQPVSSYAYVANNPLQDTDPSGACPVCAIAGAVVGGASGLVGYTLGVAATNLTSGDGLSLDGWDGGQAAIATGAGAASGAICAVTALVGCMIAGGTASEAQYALSPGEKTLGGALWAVGTGAAISGLFHGSGSGPKPSDIVDANPMFTSGMEFASLLRGDDFLWGLRNGFANLPRELFLSTAAGQLAPATALGYAGK